MTQPLAFGRKLPLNDWEGDDFTPGAGGAYVTCVDTSVGRAVAWATNGRITKDGQAYRAAVPGHDPNGISLPQAQIAVGGVAHLPLIIPSGWTWGTVSSWLMLGNGLVGIGRYDSLERAYRYQLAGAFQHAMWFSHRSVTSGIRTWDPLNPDIHAWGRWLPAAAIRAFLDSGADSNGHYQVAYVPLQHL
jgi:hypothetical protein